MSVSCGSVGCRSNITLSDQYFTIYIHLFVLVSDSCFLAEEKGILAIQNPDTSGIGNEYLDGICGSIRVQMSHL